MVDLSLHAGAWGTSGGKAIGSGNGTVSGGGLGDLDLTHSPTGLWTFTDDSLADLSGNGNTLVKQAGTTSFVDEGGVTWLYLDGSTYFKVTTETGLYQIGGLNLLNNCFLRNIKIIPSALTADEDKAEFELSHG